MFDKNLPKLFPCDKIDCCCWWCICSLFEMCWWLCWWLLWCCKLLWWWGWWCEEWKSCCTAASSNKLLTEKRLTFSEPFSNRNVADAAGIDVVDDSLDVTVAVVNGGEDIEADDNFVHIWLWYNVVANDDDDVGKVVSGDEAADDDDNDDGVAKI